MFSYCEARTTMLYRRSLIFCLLALVGVSLGKEIFKNPSFENGNGGWYCQGCTMERVQDAYNGKWGMKVTGRQDYWAGIAQAVSGLKPANLYNCVFHLKLLNGQGAQEVRIQFALEWSDGHKSWSQFGPKPRFLVAGDFWTGLGGAVRIPWRNGHITSARIYVEIKDKSVNYIADEASFYHAPDVDWKANALNNIENIRKSDLKVHLAVDPKYNPSDIKVEIQQKKSLFAFGTAVAASLIVDPSKKAYQDYFYNTFEWAVMENAMKWHEMERNEGQINYDWGMKAVDALRSRGIKIRGHAVFWGVETYVPAWLKTKSASEVKQSVLRRINGVVKAYKGKLEHWDVNNEVLNNGRWFEQKTGDWQILKWMFSEIHKVDPDVKLFLNHYNVINWHEIVEEYVDLAIWLRDSKAGLGGIGLQGHFEGNKYAPDYTDVKNTIDRMGSVGVPVYVTELDIQNKDKNKLAEWYENLITLFYGHPAVKGVLLWGYWDKAHWRPDAALANGGGFQINEAGWRVQHLIKKKWKTSQKTTLKANKETIQLRGFQGDYELVVKYKDQELKKQAFVLGVNNTEIFVTVGNVATTAPVRTTPAEPPTPLPNSINSLACTTRLSPLSDVGDDKHTEQACSDGEVLTGCSSYTKDRSERHDGEIYTTSKGKPVCRAFNGDQSADGVYAVARCCKGPGLYCKYIHAGPSGMKNDDKIQAICERGSVATGCSAHTLYSSMDGAYPYGVRKCVAQNDGQLGGVNAHAACCTTSKKMTCLTKYGNRSGATKGDKSTGRCDAGYTLMGCNVYAEYGSHAGSFISDRARDECTAVNGKDRSSAAEGVRAVFVCCKIL